MTSVLAQQLQALGVKGHALPRPKGRASLLFADQQAADIDLQTIHELASQGMSMLWFTMACKSLHWRLLKFVQLLVLQ